MCGMRPCATAGFGAVSVVATWQMRRLPHTCYRHRVVAWVREVPIRSWVRRQCVKRILLVMALVLVRAATAASAAMARQKGFSYLYDSELGAIRCLPSKKACEQAQANDPMALSECIKFNKIFR